MSAKGTATQAIHGQVDALHRAAVFPLYLASTFAVPDSDMFAHYLNGDPEAANTYVYSRYGNPTVRNVEERLAVLEQAEDCLLFNSGMSAITAAILSVARAGDTVVASRPLYGGSYHLLREIAPRLGLKTRLLEAHQLYELARYAPEAKLVFFETPANPTCLCHSIPQIVAAARQVGAATMVDNTFASPINQTPLALGVDVVVHSATKYLGGHSDLIAGAVMTSRERIEAVREMAIFFGGYGNAFDAFLIDRSLKTLTVRMQAHNAAAAQIAAFFAAEPKVRAVYYPGLPGTPDYEIARQQMHGFGGMMAIELADTAAAKTFCDALRVGLNAVSLGGVETLLTIPVLSTHAKVDDEERRIARVQPGTVRVSIGLEDPADLLADFAAALARV
ncbi:MAG: PLP-dependent aspartate aminotransferase family protein [Anaerolineae bacterium]|jgi:cystathionine beta-lyase/cystathionine gamma-synthase|nr:PLP-dependent aspartate aminotransferase family protein [Anaerolineae bacterium]